VSQARVQIEVPAQRKLTIFQINDTHGYLEPHPELVWSKDGPSYPIMGGVCPHRHAAQAGAERESRRGWNVIPVDPSISVVDLTGSEIRAMMEENLERTFSADPFAQMGGYLKRFRGLTIYGKLENPSGNRIERVFTSYAGNWVMTE
jgi:2',3'-cyclic-nucleotide 2'-phosphodiesterase (5'-nucleotidase family)